MLKQAAVIVGTLALVLVSATAGAKPRQQSPIVCNERGCSDHRVNQARFTTAAIDANGNEDGHVVGRRPDGCPHAFCGCEASLYVFGHIRSELNLASNWAKFPRTSPAPGMAAVRNHHVVVLMSHVEGSNWMVHDGNAGGGVTREHIISISGYIVVNPRGS